MNIFIVIVFIENFRDYKTSHRGKKNAKLFSHIREQKSKSKHKICK